MHIVARMQVPQEVLEVLASEEVRSAAVRQQAAIVRALVDQVEHAEPSPVTDSLRDQLAEELARLQCKLAAAA
jgi:preprotein translocase subunit SecD